MGKYKSKLSELQNKLDKNRPDMLVAAMKAVLAALFVFTFLSGFVFTVIPLSRNVWHHTQLHVIQPINQWIAEEPVFGNHMVFVVQAATTIIFLWLIRHRIHYMYVWVLSWFEKKPTLPGSKKLPPPKKKPTEPRRTQPTNKPATKEKS